MTAVEVISVNTESMPKEDRFSYLVDELNRKFTPVEMDSTERRSDSFFAKAEVLRTDRFELHAVNASTMSIQRTPTVMSLSNPPIACPYGLALRRPHDGNTVDVVKQGRQQAILKDGDVALFDVRRELDIRVSASGLNANFIRFPDQFIERRIPDIQDALALGLDCRKGWAKVLSNYILGLSPAMMLDMVKQQPIALDVISDHVATLLSFAIEEARGGGVEGGYGPQEMRRRQLLADIKSWLNDYYADETLDVRRLAEEFSISPRQIHRLFATGSDEKQSFLDTLHGIRIQAAMSMLADRRLGHLLISGVAFRCGFGDTNTFRRIFKRATNLTPEQYRQARLNPK